MTRAKQLAKHKRSAQIHMDARVIERIGIRFNRHDAREIMDEIDRKEHGQGYGDMANTNRTWYLISRPNLSAWVCYDRYLHRLVTCLEPTEIPRTISETMKRQLERRLDTNAR